MDGKQKKSPGRSLDFLLLSVYVCFFFRGPLGLDSGRMGAPLGK